MEKLSIGIDIGGTHFRIGAVDEKGRVADFRKLPVTQVLPGRDLMKELVLFLKDYCKDKQVKLISIGFPATLDAARKLVLQAPNVPGMENLPVVQTLEAELELPVFIERDVTMALHYDSWILNLTKQGIICGFYFGTGVGNAICINGHPLVGKHGTAGELGHIPVDGNDRACGCGNRGCMETLAGGKFLMELCRREFPQLHVSQLFACHPDHPELQRFVDRMAMAVATEINILDPDHILIGGGVPSMEGFPKELLQERICFYTRKPYPAADLKIHFVSDNEEKTVIGAAFYGATQYTA